MNMQFQDKFNSGKRTSKPGVAATKWSGVRHTGLLLMLLAAGGVWNSASAQTLTTLYSFNGTSGANPQSSLITDASGNLYGATYNGGANGFGTVFKLTPSGTQTVIHSFGGGSDGKYPQAGLIADASGNLYGTTFSGGPNDLGTVFKVRPSGTETVLHSFGSSPNDGANPYAGLIADASGNLYGATSGGGAYGAGTVFKVTPSGTGTVLYSFGSSANDGAIPFAGLIADASGNLYGTTGYGGAYGAGTVFKVTPSGTGTVLYSFGSFAGDGTNPYAGLIADASGNLYGTTQFGGANFRGTVFKVTPSGTETVLYSFGSSAGDGRSVWFAGLIADASGNLYGATSSGGANEGGTVFKVTPSGTHTVLHSFSGSDGLYPAAGLIADASGNLYGTTSDGGANGAGTVFKLRLSAGFIGVPGQPNCVGQTISFMAKQYGGLAAAARALGYSSVEALQNAVTAYCGR